MTSQVLFSRHGQVGVITLNRPEKLNAFADRMRDDLAVIIRTAANDDAVGALVITGAGRAFSAGADIVYMYDLVAREDWDALEGLVEAGAAIVSMIDRLHKPVLAAVNGVAAGGGASLALACDIRVAATSASLGQTFNRIGLQPDWGGTYFLPRLLGLGLASEMVFTGDLLSAEDALRLGLFNRVVDDAVVVVETVSLAARIAAKPPEAIALAKHSLRKGYNSTLSQALERERVHQLRLFKTAEAREGMLAFLERHRSTQSKRP